MPQLKDAPLKDLLPDSGAPPALVLWVLRVVAVIAAGISGYLAWVGLFAEDVVGCGGMGMDCAGVLASRWAKWFGLPVGLLAGSLYLSLVLTLAFAGPLSPANVRRLAWRLSTWMIYAAAAAGVWFIHLQWLAVEGFCPWCVSVHACAIGMAILAMAAGREAAAQKSLAVAVALAALAVLAGGQLFGPQPAPQIATDRLEGRPAAPAARLEINEESRPPAGISMSDLVLQESPVGRQVLKPPAEITPDQDDGGLFGENTNTLAIETTPPVAGASGDGPSRMVTVFVGNGQVAQVDAYQHPILGSPQAKHVFVKLFDYTCGHCREMHGHLSEARQKFGDDFAVLMLPVPLNPDCNPHIRERKDKHAHACQLAALALAVWQADGTKFAEFDRWLFEPEHAPSVSDARAKAARLVGQENLDAALGDWRVSQRMTVGVELYKMSGAGSVPKILTPNTKLTGAVSARAEMLRILARELGVQTATTTP